MAKNIHFFPKRSFLGPKYLVFGVFSTILIFWKNLSGLNILIFHHKNHTYFALF